MPGMLVSPQWARKVDKSIKSDSRDCKSSSVNDLYYLIRPAQITSAWSNNQATGVLDDGTEIQIFDPTSQAEIPIDSYCNVVYRGRWEILSSAGQGGSAEPRIGYVTSISYADENYSPLYTLTNGDVVYDPLAPSSYVLAAGDKIVYLPCSGSTYQGVVIQAEPLA